MKLNYTPFFDYLKTTDLAAFVDVIADQTTQAMGQLSHGDFQRWFNDVDALPEISTDELDFNVGAARIGTAETLGPAQSEQLREALLRFRPWRKGPFEIFGIHIDTEWRSDWKWQRLCQQISPLKDRLVLDVGSGNGYYLLRMLGQGCKAAIGIDPFILYVMQFQALNKYIRTHRVSVLPLKDEQFPAEVNCFDTVFSMGVLYHRKDPGEHLENLRRFLRPGGELVLETLVLESDKNNELIPEGRYAKMRNVWSIPSPTKAVSWLEKCGFENIRVVDITRTSLDEQRQTDWMTFESLADFLDTHDQTRTIEGYPAPVRAVIIANKAGSTAKS